jgi:hypothetical protein
MRIDDALALLRYVKRHDLSSCSDEEPRNYYTIFGRGGYPRCTRCLLLAVVEGKVTGGVIVQVRLQYEDELDPAVNGPFPKADV